MMESQSSSATNVNSQGTRGVFSCSQGKTYLQKRNGNKICIFDFTMRKIAAVENSKNTPEEFRNHWIFEFKSKDEKTGSYTSRLVALAGKCFESKSNFSNGLSEQAEEFVHIPPVVNAEILSSYLQFLQEEYLVNPASFKVADIIGSYECGVWVLSNETQVKDLMLVPDIERKYVVLGKMQKFSLTIEIALLGVERVVDVFSKLIDYSAAFGANKIPFLQVMSFAIMRLIKSKKKEAPADEAKYCVIYSPEKSIGKTKTLMMVAQGEGIKDPSDHLFSIAGGNGFLNGTSCKMQQKLFASTNLLVIVNEIKMSPTIANMLNQCHDSLCSGSLGTGILKSRASIIGSSNQKEHERLQGRMVRVNYETGEFSDSMDKLMKNRMEPLCENNVGFLLAWCMRYEDYWAFVESLVKYPLHTLVKEKLPQRQSRYTWTITGNLITFYALFITTNKRCQPGDIFNRVVCADEIEEKNFLQRLCSNLMELFKSSSEIFTWFNPSTSFTDEKRANHLSFAIRATFFTTFNDVSLKELNECLAKYGKNAWQVNCRFCVDPLLTLDDVNKVGKVKDDRAYKFPWSIIPPECALQLREQLGLGYDEAAEVISNSSSAERINNIFERMKSVFNEFYTQNVLETENSTESDDEVIKNMDEVDTALYRHFSPNCKRAFQMGMQYGAVPTSRRKLDVDD